MQNYVGFKRIKANLMRFTWRGLGVGSNQGH